MIAVTSCFSQLLSLIDRAEFGRAVKQHKAERGAKGFSCWEQFVAMLFCQMGAAHSLREICGGLATAMGRLVHLGMRAAPSRSTLAYANSHRPWQLYQRVFEDLLKQCQAVAARKQRRFRFKHPLRSLDGTVIELCVTIFDWARFQRTKGAVKLHLQLDHQGYLPCCAVLTDANTSELSVARQMEFSPGSIVIMDRGYLDYALYEAWDKAGVYFVTRAHTNMVYKVLAKREVAPRGNVLRDEKIQLSSAYAQKRCQSPLRRVMVWNSEHKREFVFLTNIHHLAASTIAAIYKDRWQIELFFKALKQNLKIKTFVGTSENAVKVQIWTALIAMLLLKFLLLKSTWAWSLSNLAAMLRFNLLSYRDLWAWLDAPFKIPIAAPAGEQIVLFE
jgi:IS4 transposase